MDIHSLMDRFSKLDGAAVGSGPKHLVSPDVELQKTINHFLEQHPFLRRDQGYIDFLEGYAGASIERLDKPDVVLDIFGFTDVSSHLITGEGDVINPDGFFDIAGGTYPGENYKQKSLPYLLRIKSLGCCLDTTGKREWGIYRTRYNQAKEKEVYWYCRTFLEWLEILIDTDGHMPDEAPGKASHS